MDREYIKRMREKVSGMSDDELVNVFESELNTNNIIEDEYIKAYVVAKMQDDRLRMKYIPLLDERKRFDAIKSLKSQDDKIKCINEMEDQIWIADAVANLLTDENKLKFISKVKSLELKNKILNEYNDFNIEHILSIENDFDKALIISKMKDESEKIKLLSNLKDDSSKAIVIRDLIGDDIKVKLIEDIKDEKARVSIIEKIKDRNIRDDLLEIKENKRVISIPDKMTVGIEIECEGDESEKLFFYKEIIEGWKTKTDISLENGVEINSPVMNNSSENTRDLYQVCEILKVYNQKSSERCGGHVHIGADYLKSKESLINLIELWANNEKIIYLISNKSGDLFRDGALKYAKPLSKKLENAKIEDIYSNDSSFIGSVKEYLSKDNGDDNERHYRRLGMNLFGVNSYGVGRNTVEFRIPNGTINAETWVDNINLFGGIIGTAEKIAQLEQRDESELNDEEKNIIETFDTLNTEDLQEKDRMNMFLDIIVPEENKQIYVDRYNENKKLLTNNKELNKDLDKDIASKPIIFEEGTFSSIDVSVAKKDEAQRYIQTKIKERQMDRDK